MTLSAVERGLHCHSTSAMSSSKHETGGLNLLSTHQLIPAHPGSLSTLLQGVFSPYILAPLCKASHVIWCQTKGLVHCEGKCGYTGLTER